MKLIANVFCTKPVPAESLPWGLAAEAPSIVRMGPLEHISQSRIPCSSGKIMTTESGGMAPVLGDSFSTPDGSFVGDHRCWGDQRQIVEA